MPANIHTHTHALLLAAGIGNRLGNESNNSPKCLLEFEGRSLLERHIQCLSENNIENLTVITGFQAVEIETKLEQMQIANMYIQTVQNPDFREGSVISLWSGRDAVESAEQILLMDADVLYSNQILRTLVNSSNENSFLLDRDFEPGDEPVKICIKDNKIVEFRKKVADSLDYDVQGESVGFFSFSNHAFSLMIDVASDYIREGRRQEPYEEVIRDVVLDYPELFSCEDITGQPWIEIDFPEDIMRAKNTILPQINQ